MGLRSLAATRNQAEADDGTKERQTSGLGDGSDDVDREGVRVCARTEGVEINAGVTPRVAKLWPAYVAVSDKGAPEA